MDNMMDCSATIGFFDGVHKGHQYMISRLIADARAHGLRSAVVTFRQHPRQVLQQDYIPQLLTLHDRKEQLLRGTGIDEVVMLDFTLPLSRLTAREFMLMLKEKAHVRRLLIGYDHRFGHNRSEGFDDYKRYGGEIGIEVVANDAFSENGTNISSSVIRKLVSAGDVALAGEYLGYRYGFKGVVIHGMGEGKRIGFPTANMSIAKEQLVPKHGVYAVEVQVDGEDGKYLGMMNIGCRPTYGTFGESLEVNILDFDSDIYGREISVSFLGRLRDERKFDSIEDLVRQLRSDKEEVRHVRL